MLNGFILKGMSHTEFRPQRHSFQTDDPRLLPIAEKVIAEERLSFD